MVAMRGCYQALTQPLNFRDRISSPKSVPRYPRHHDVTHGDTTERRELLMLLLLDDIRKYAEVPVSLKEIQPRAEQQAKVAVRMKNV